MKRYTIKELNDLPQAGFTGVVGPVFEHSPWIAERAWAKRPFANVEALHQVLCETVKESGAFKQLDLIRAHPDLVGRAALAGALTASSTNEQASAGLNRLTPDEISRFQKCNEEYRERFGFPFVICARLNKKEAILVGFEVRLKNNREQEVQAALAEIGKIAWLRLQDLCVADD